MLDLLRQKWHASFANSSPEIVVRAPGRVNIIGEHTDYNEGWVLPGAMSRCIYIFVAHSQSERHHWIAHDLEEEFLRDMRSPENKSAPAWVNYLQGALTLYAPDMGALNILVGGDLPVGGGISSSSALVCGFIYALHQLTSRSEPMEAIALTGSRVEREIMGLQGGIMDQFAIMLSRKDQVMLLDCRTKFYRFIAAELPGFRWILINTKVKHALIDSDYNQRAAECKEAVALLQAVYPDIRSLRDVTPDMLTPEILSEKLLRRAGYVLEENERVHQMVDALTAKDHRQAGQLLQASHAGLQYKYEVSCSELDHLADFANGYDGIMGARMMGGGFGGCVICLLREDVLEDFSQACIQSYTAQFGFAPEIILFELGDGVEKV